MNAKFCVGAAATSCGTCDANANCDTSGSAPTCVCNAGFVGDGTSCAPESCPALSIVDGTVSNPNSVSVGASISYGCNLGFQLSATGDATRTCLSGGVWSGTAPSCDALPPAGCSTDPCQHGTCSEGAGGSYTCACDAGYQGSNCDMPVQCTGLLAPANGSVSPSSATVGQSATYSCDAGYELVGAATQTCQANGSWSDSAPSCVALPCPTLTIPPDGSVSSTTGTTGTVVTYSCNGGFVLSGSVTRTCGTDSQWTGTKPTCTPANDCSANPCVHSASCTDTNPGYDCGVCDPGWTGPNCDAPVSCSGASAPTNGTVSAASATYGQDITYACNQGYDLIGSSTSTCGANGNFSPAAPTCQIKTCSGAMAPANGSVSALTATFGQSVTYSCDAGYTLNGTATRACGADGQFGGMAPNCAANACPALSAPNGGSVSSTAGVTGDIVTFSCNAGLVLVGNSTRTCGTDSQWSGTNPTCEQAMVGCASNPCVHATSCTPSGATDYTCACEPGWMGANCDVAVPCDTYSAPANGAVNPPVSSYQDTVTYSCNAGYMLQGSATRVCGSNGELQGVEPSCAPISCSGATAPTNGSVSASTVTFGQSITYACGAGYVLTGNGGLATRSCLADGTFSGTTPTCEAVACSPNLVAPMNGSVSRTMGVTGDVATYGCDAGYRLVGGAVRNCKTDSTWSGTAPLCELIQTGCEPNPCVHSASCTPSGATGFSCGVCDAGWTGATCDTPITCAPLTSPANGTISAPTTTAGSSVSYSCDAGYNLNGNATRTCQANGVFNGTDPTCVPVVCTGATAPTNGVVSAPNASFGNTVSYGCNQGYQLNGAPTRTCGADGSFAGTAPTCVPTACTPNLAAPTNGSVSQTMGVTGDIATYGCVTGYRLVGDTTRTCQSSGSWTGTAPTCELVMTGCTPNPCDNGGTCSPQGATGFTCACASGWSGTTCATPVTCSGATAPTNGAVSAGSATSGNAVTYSCSAGYTLNGAAQRVCAATGLWATAAPTCTANACATLSNPANGSVTPATGTTGSSSMYSCSTGYVLVGNGGSNTRTCQASGSWSGSAPTCELVQTGCDVNPCNNGGTCSPAGATGFSCTCATGWSGTTCDTGAPCTGLTNPTNGSVSSSSANYPNSVTYSCNAGYTLSGQGTRQCTSGGTWAGTAPTCTPNACSPNLVAPANGTVSRTTGVTGDVANYACAAGFDLGGNGGSSQRTCQTSGAWSGSAPTCTQSQSLCSPNPCANGGTCTQSGASTTCACAAGYSGPTCTTAAQCTGALAPSNGTVSASSVSFPGSVTYSCNAGYTLSGTASRACGSNGAWTTGAPSCTANTCSPNLVAPTGGSVSITTGTTGMVATYACNDGSTPVGAATTTCLATGAWSNPAPTCPTAPQYCDVVYRLNTTGTDFRVKKTGTGSMDVWKGVGTNGSSPTGVTTPFGTTFSRGFIRLRYPAASGEPVAGTVQLIEYYLPMEFSTSVLGTTVTTNTDHSVGLLNMRTTGCADGADRCLMSGNTQTLNRTCTPHGQGTLTGTSLGWGACSLAPPAPPASGANSTPDWTTGSSQIAAANIAANPGCIYDMSGFGNVTCSGTFCGLAPTGVQNNTWDQKFNSFVYSGTNYRTATIQMLENTLPDPAGDVYSSVRWSTATPIAVECGTAAALTCNEL